MDPYDTGYAFGRLFAFGCCALVVIAAVGGLIWFVVAQSRKSKTMPSPPYPQPPQQYPPQQYPPQNPPPPPGPPVP